MTATLLELGSKPIRSDAVAGESARDEPEFEAVQREVKKLEAPDQPSVDWSIVIENATTILENKSKDILVASYLAVALTGRRGFAGLADGLAIFRQILANFWDTLFPSLKRMRGRQAAVEWLAHRGAQLVKQASGTAEEIGLCKERLSELGEILASRFDSGDSLLGELHRALDEVAARRSQPSPPPPGPRPAGGPAKTVPSSIQSPGDVEKALDETRRLAIAVSSHLRETEPTNPIAYRFPRSVIWMRITGVQAQPDGRTQIPPPPPGMKDQLEEACGEENWPATLNKSEERFPNAVLWLDLQRYTVTALDGMGEAYSSAAEAVCEELALFLRRHPGLIDLRFQSNESLCDDATRAWIRDRVMTTMAAGGESSPTQPRSTLPDDTHEGGLEGFPEAKTEAWKLARKKKLGEAMAILEQGARRAGMLRERTHWRLEMARVCIDRKQFGAALSQLEVLDRELNDATFDDWDPKIAAEIITGLYSCRRALLPSRGQVSPDHAAREQELMSRLSRIDVLSALELNGKK